MKRPHLHGFDATHMRLLHKSRRIFESWLNIIEFRKQLQPLCHADLHKTNMTVSDDDLTVITDLVYWQSSSREPPFVHSDYISGFATPLIDASPEEKPTEIQAALCSEAFEACIRGLIPKLQAARALDDDLRRSFHYCHRGTVLQLFDTSRSKFSAAGRRWVLRVLAHVYRPP